MDSEYSSAQLLERLDRFLAEPVIKWEEKGPESNAGELNDPTYAEQNRIYHKVQENRNSPYSILKKRLLI